MMIQVIKINVGPKSKYVIMGQTKTALGWRETFARGNRSGELCAKGLHVPSKLQLLEIRKRKNTSVFWIRCLYNSYSIIDNIINSSIIHSLSNQAFSDLIWNVNPTQTRTLHNNSRCQYGKSSQQNAKLSQNRILVVYEYFFEHAEIVLAASIVNKLPLRAH